MSDQPTYRASCFCGDVQITLKGQAELQAYCHCDSCRRWSGGPVNAFTLWQPGNVEVTQGLDKIAGFDGNPGSDHEGVVSKRKWCKSCGGHVFTDHPAMGLVDVPSAAIVDFAFEPAFHVHYRESVHRVTDGLTKFGDLPEAAGGSGLELAE
ncbi:MAG: GFA family protein [Gammaproteobacteria bacterium]|nr:GFA family protein [Gammaproteobacteria bacterium]MDH3537780.1 GFA family protein [Gammaproteobacteria bacterium]